MNKLQQFLAKLDHGFLDGLPQVKELEKLDRLFPVLVRCGACRFTCGAQYYETLQNHVNAGGDYVRDVSIPIGGDARAAAWVPECPVTPAAMVRQAFVAPRPHVDAWTAAAKAAAHSAQQLETERLLAQARAAGDNATVRAILEGMKSSASPRGWDCIPAFREEDCGGVFDGRGVVSDADPGL